MELKEIVAPNLERQKKTHELIKDVSYYIIIGLISLIVMFILPILTGCLYGDIGIAFPESTEGWILYAIVKIGCSAANVCIFVLFKQQAKTNVRNDPKYIQANEKLVKEVLKTSWRPRSPRTMNTKEYVGKGITLFLTTLISSIAVASLIISFDMVTFISCIISAIMALVFGWTTMLKNEVYWTEEFPLWVEYITKENTNGN